MHKKMEAILTRVQKPARYVGGEWGSVMKDKKNVDLRFAFCFPDTYEVAMSHLGSRILYGLLNDQKGIWCERVCAPWIDMEAEMRAAGIPLYGLESGDPLTEFDIIAFTLQYELSFSNILNMLDLAGIPIHSAERTGLTPYFHAVVDGTQIARSKPDPEVFLKAAQALGVSPAEALVVEDAAAGVRAARCGGFSSAALGPAAHDQDTL